MGVFALNITMKNFDEDTGRPGISQSDGDKLLVASDRIRVVVSCGP